MIQLCVVIFVLNLLIICLIYKTLIDYTNLFSSHDFKNKIIKDIIINQKI